MLTDHTVALGNIAEELACRFLQKQGLEFIQKNYRIKNGEIDLIMRDQDVLVFIEVKSRTQPSHGHAIEMLSMTKQNRIIRAARYYLQSNRLTEKARCRFDVVGVSGKKQELMWIKNAFEVIY